MRGAIAPLADALLRIRERLRGVKPLFFNSHFQTRSTSYNNEKTHLRGGRQGGESRLSTISKRNLELTGFTRVWYAGSMKKGQKLIREITDLPLESSVDIIRRAFGTVAEEMGITEENAPRYTAFINKDKLEQTRQKGAKFWGLFIDGKQTGFVAVEKEDDGRYWMKRLAVLPEFRHGGNGKALVDTAIAYTRSKGEKKIYIGIVNEEKVLKDWYKAMGFKETSVQKFEYLPFSVCFMELDII